VAAQVLMELGGNPTGSAQQVIQSLADASQLQAEQVGARRPGSARAGYGRSPAAPGVPGRAAELSGERWPARSSGAPASGSC
jgi:hypothetical protein